MNWDKPLPNAVDVVLGSEAQSSAVAGLAFALVTPRLPRSANLLRVSDPAAVPAEGRAAAFRYDFSGATGYPADGRVVVYEGVPHNTQQGLEDIAANPPGDPGDYSVVPVAGLKVLLNQHGGVGRVRFIYNGVLFDITGPAVPAARVLDIALNIVAPST